MPIPHPKYRPAPAPESIQTTTLLSNPLPRSQIHHYTLCPHTSPPCTRPLNVEPTPDLADSTGVRSALAGSCGDCDTKARRRAEAKALTTYANKMKSLAMQQGVWDEDFLNEQAANSLRVRDQEVGKIWKGYSSRWGIGCVGKEGDGRMKLAWERPERRSEGEGEGKEKEKA